MEMDNDFNDNHQLTQRHGFCITLQEDGVFWDSQEQDESGKEAAA